MLEEYQSNNSNTPEVFVANTCPMCGEKCDTYANIALQKCWCQMDASEVDLAIIMNDEKLRAEIEALTPKQPAEFKGYQHIVSNIPNNWFWQLVIKLIRRKMRKSNSKYYLVLRGRRPSKPEYKNYGHSLPLSKAKRMSVYFREK